MTKPYRKYIERLSKQEKKLLLEIIERIEVLDLEGLDIKKLQGIKNQFRIRAGKIRIIFENQGTTGKIIEVGSRGDVYKGL